MPRVITAMLRRHTHQSAGSVTMPWAPAVHRVADSSAGSWLIYLVSFVLTGSKQHGLGLEMWPSHWSMPNISTLKGRQKTQHWSFLLDLPDGSSRAEFRTAALRFNLNLNLNLMH